ncbi:AMP-binding protein, partial [Nocardia paucivorans]|uniref:AMP-binding protein n=1 Tax=Nocardia paucivorans TaxID=114259 RepID=UPI001C3F2FA5
MSVAFTYATDLFDAVTVEALARRWVRVLESVVGDPGVVVGEIELLDSVERADLLSRGGSGVGEMVPLADVLVAAAGRDPEALAVVCGGRRVSYGELDGWSNRLARVLIRRGVGPEDVVAVGVRRSFESVLAVWAVAKSGAAFLPIDPT